jgi:hypothetical protein
MAIEKTITLNTGIVVENCVHVVDVVSIVGRSKMHFSILCYVKNAGAESFNPKTYIADYDIDGPNPIKQAYQYLHSLPDFEGAIKFP